MISTRHRFVRSLGLLTLAFAATTLHAKVYHVYYLGGQSNMDGFGFTKDLNEDQRHAMDGCMIFHGNNQNAGDTPKGHGIWAALTSGHGVGFGTDGQTNRLGDRFGPELTFGAQMRELYPDRNIAIIKFSRGGSSIAQDGNRPCWDPHDQRDINGNIGMNQYDFALKTIDNALSIRDIDGDGEDDTLIPAGIVWMQGESDGNNESAAQAYEQNLAELMELFRASLRMDGVPVAIGRISDSHLRDNGQPVWRFGDQIRESQARYCERDPNAILVTSTDGYGYSDPYHYDSAGYVDLGRAFAKAIHALESGNADD